MSTIQQYLEVAAVTYPFPLYRPSPHEYMQ